MVVSQAGAEIGVKTLTVAADIDKILCINEEVDHSASGLNLLKRHFGPRGQHQKLSHRWLWLGIEIDDMKGDRMIERIVVMGVDVPPSSVVVSDGAPIEFEYDSVVKVLVLRKPDVSALVDWEITIA
ncbi:hypothetical protein MHU86_17117 [Fragilaria crotonensis]|nr:hypothetical protein MHU86_17117 [Fragilaria crotonensis]